MFGGFLGAVLAGVVLAVLVAVVYGLIRHRLPGGTDFARIVLLAALGFGTVGLLPAMKIPANPPAVGDSDTIGDRTAIYGAVLVSGIVMAMLVAALVSLLRSRGVTPPATVIGAVAATVLLVACLLVLLPDSPDGIPADVPADAVWEFRLASLGQLAVLWGALGLVGGWSLDRLTGEPALTR